MIINLKRCIGCDACALGCKQANGTPPGIFWSHVIHKEVGEFPTARVEYTPMLCMHCENAPCVKACPTGASVKEANGIVHVIQDKCIGCKQCVVVCPYKARWYLDKNIEGYYPGQGLTAKEKATYGDFVAGRVSKCNFCMDKVAAGDEPLCAQTCPASARIFGDLDDPGSEAAKLMRTRNPQPLGTEYGTNPSVFYIR
jgi:molybdopterin-containing oxidoreductase family iron-sulfur binding subunit